MIEIKFNVKEVVKELEELNDEGKYDLHPFDQSEFYRNNLNYETFRLIDCYCPDAFEGIEEVKGECTKLENGLYACKRCFLRNFKDIIKDVY